jgi:hypothetical protein
MVALRLQSSLSRFLVDEPDLAHAEGFWKGSGAVVSFPRVGPGLLSQPAAPIDRVPGTPDEPLDDDLALRHVLFASLATRWHTPSGGGLPGSILNGVTVGSCR